MSQRTDINATAPRLLSHIKSKSLSRYLWDRYEEEPIRLALNYSFDIDPLHFELLIKRIQKNILQNTDKPVSELSDKELDFIFSYWL